MRITENVYGKEASGNKFQKEVKYLQKIRALEVSRRNAIDGVTLQG
jgi:hypothetical protein